MLMVVVSLGRTQRGGLFDGETFSEQLGADGRFVSPVAMASDRRSFGGKARDCVRPDCHIDCGEQPED